MRRTHVESDNLNEGLIGRLIALGVLVLTLNVAGAVTPSAGAQKPDAAAGNTSTSVSFEQVKGWVEAYKAAHPGNGGKAWDINAKTPEELATDPAAKQLLSVCGQNQRPVIPLLAWEYGGGDHQWIAPHKSALVYCVYTPVKTPSANWRYDAGREHVTADVYVKFPEQNPCKGQQGASQVNACVGDETNFEILVDTANIDDGRDAGLSLAEASTTLRLILADGNKVDLWFDQ